MKNYTEDDFSFDGYSRRIGKQGAGSVSVQVQFNVCVPFKTTLLYLDMATEKIQWFLKLEWTSLKHYAICKMILAIQLSN